MLSVITRILLAEARRTERRCERNTRNTSHATQPRSAGPGHASRRGWDRSGSRHTKCAGVLGPLPPLSTAASRNAASSPQPPRRVRSTVDHTEGIPHTGFHAGSFSARDEPRVAAKAARRRVRIMSATLHQPLPHHEPVAAPAARLALKTDGTSRGLLDGAWWP